jgi:hypothetical protein
MAWVGLFRNAHLPPFPVGTPETQSTVTYTMQYRIIR